MGKVKNRNRSDWQLYKPTRERNVVAVLVMFGTLAVALAVWALIGEMWALLPIVVVIMPIEWLILGFLVMRWRKEDREAGAT